MFLLFQGGIFRFHVCFQGCTWNSVSSQTIGLFQRFGPLFFPWKFLPSRGSYLQLQDLLTRSLLKPYNVGLVKLHGARRCGFWLNPRCGCKRRVEITNACAFEAVWQNETCCLFACLFACLSVCLFVVIFLIVCCCCFFFCCCCWTLFQPSKEETAWLD